MEMAGEHGLGEHRFGSELHLLGNPRFPEAEALLLWRPIARMGRTDFREDTR
jgi:hypothetical protein